MRLETVWRITRAPFADLTGEGARLYGGRWNPVGVPLVYASSTLALAALETLVHTDPDLIPDDLVALRIDVSAATVETPAVGVLPARWRDEVAGAGPQGFGRDWARSRRSGLLVLPSAILPEGAGDEEVNVLINPLHPEVAGIRTADQIPFTFDPRLLAH